MANTIVKGKFGISITFDGATAWDSVTDFPSGMKIESLEFKPAATDDVMAVREVDANGRLYFSSKAATAYDNKIKYFNTEKSQKRFYPYIVGNQATVGTILIIEFK